VGAGASSRGRSTPVAPMAGAAVARAAARAREGRPGLAYKCVRGRLGLAYR
jgi:hypothetical protein